jgi:(p)ppGpp synthase/HD superfamily hydrolase
MESKIDKAIAVAAKAHNGQARKGDGITPYIVHPIAVGMLVARYVDDENIICAAILHDVLEDTDYSRPKLKRQFGNRIFSMVEEVTDKKPKDHWAKRKEAYLKKIKMAPKGACLIACADKINNLHSIVDAYKKFGDKIWKRFEAPKEAKVAFYEGIYREVGRRFRHPLIGKLGSTLKQAKRALGLRKQ